MVVLAAHVTGTSARQHGNTELCSILNSAIRADDPYATIHAAVFAHAININLMKSRVVKAEPWLQKIFKKTYPYVSCLGELDCVCFFFFFF